MSIKPEEINAGKLPSAVRGYQREATENLLKLVAWDYRRALRDQAAAAEETQKAQQRAEELQAEVEALREQLSSQADAHEVGLDQHVARRTAQLETENARLRATIKADEGRRELTQSLLQAAMHSAREAREQARAECDALIKAARRRALQIEDEARNHARRSSSELVRLQKLERDLRDQLRRTLQQVIAGDAAPTELPRRVPLDGAPRPSEQHPA